MKKSNFITFIKNKQIGARFASFGLAIFLWLFVVSNNNYSTIIDIPIEKRLELPVAEEMQMGMTLGLAMDKNVPISIFPRWNFLLYGINQLINHIDKFKVMCGKEIVPKIIIRTSIGSQRPLHPQFQHIGDFSEAVQKMCSTIQIIKLDNPKKIFLAYKKAYDRKDGVTTILVEYGDYYNEK